MKPERHQLDASEYGRLLALVAISVLIWCFAYNRWSAESWKTPLEYGNRGYDADTVAILAHIKSAQDGNFWPLLTKTVPQLGAPFTGNWNDFPIVEQMIYFCTGVLAKIVGLFPAVNIAVLIAQVLAAVCFYGVCRWLKCSWVWSFAGALIFAFSRYPFARQVHHLQVVYYWHIPACLLVCWWLSEKEGLEAGNRRYWFALAIAVVTGMQHPYYTNMFVQLAGIACIVQFLRGNRRIALAGCTIIAASLATFFLMCANLFYYKMAHGPNPNALVRAYHWLEFSALKLVDLAMPPPDHQFAPFADLAQRYFKEIFVPGEVPPSCYLGLAGIAALAWLVIVSLRRVFAQTAQPLPLEAWQVLWIILYSIVGGLNCFAGVMGIQLFRSSNRYSVFILAIVLIWALRRLSAPSWRGPESYIVPAVITVVALMDQTATPPTGVAIHNLAALVASDRAFTAEMEKRLPRGAMVFQLPLVPFPETPVPGVSAYDHFRPYLYSTHLRFSFGSTKGRPESDWQQELARVDLKTAVSTMESYGFAAMYVNRAGFQDKAEGLIKGLAELGRRDVIESPERDLVCILLNPSPHPLLPSLKRF